MSGIKIEIMPRMAEVANEHLGGATIFAGTKDNKENRQAIDGQGTMVHSAPPLLWAGITAPLVGAMMAALPACDDKKKAEADKLAADGWDLYSKSENKAAAEKYGAAADIYYKCGLFAEEAKARNWFRECMLSTNTVEPEERKVIYTKERDAFKRAAESEKDISQKIRYLWGAGEAGMRIGRDEVKAAIASYDEAFKLSLSLKESKYEYAADTRHRQASALSRAAAESQMPELAKLSETADREAAEITVLKTVNYHPAANLMKSQGPILIRSGLYKEALNAFINAASLFGSADEPSEAQEMSMSVADVRYWAIFGKGPEDELTAEWAIQAAVQNESDKQIPTSIGLLRIAASIHESQENPTGAENVLKKAASFPVEYQLAILNNYLSDADTFLRGGKLLDAITECNEGLIWAVRVKNNLGTSVKLEAADKALEAKKKAVMDAIDARWK